LPWWSLTALLLATLSVLVWLAVEIHRYFTGRAVIGGKQLVLRSVVAALLMVVVAMMVWGAYRPWKAEEAWWQLGYWTLALVLVFVIVVLTFRDWRMLIRERHLRRAELYRKMDEELGTPRQPGPKKDT
jgi:cell division protein FtsW (lipid II flippase)